MPLKVDINLAFFDRWLRRRIDGMFPAAQKAMRSGLREFIRKFRFFRMSGPRGGDKGVNRRTGALSDALEERVTGDRLSRLHGEVGWYTPKQAMKANVQEKGATIVGRPFLVYRLITRAGVDLGWRKSKRVRIPPRLEFKKYWREYYRAIVGDKIAAAIKKVTSRG